jgi:hypothetical protein
MGRDDETEGRNEWPLAALKDAKTHVLDVRDAVLDRIETATEYAVNASPEGASSYEDEQTDDDRTEDMWDADDVDWGDPF